MAADEQAARSNGEEQNIQLRKVFMKDLSFETPNSPEIFTLDWKPKLAFELNRQANDLGDSLYEIVLILTVTVKIEDQTAYLAEVHQAGIFLLQGLDPERLQRIQNVYCLNVLYPYACAALSDLVTKGGFPQLNLAPVNFRGLYEQNMQAAQQQADASDAAQV